MDNFLCRVRICLVGFVWKIYTRYLPE
jgi:hypothetical protein